MLPPEPRAARVIAAAAVTSITACLSIAVASAQAETQSFASTGAQQTFTVPDGVSSLHVVAIAGAGGGLPASKAGMVTADVAVTAGEQLFVEVGGPGAGPGASVGAFNGGGRSVTGSGGGGASSLQRCSQGCALTIDNALVVAGGGGGRGGTGFVSGDPGGSGGDGDGSPGLAGTPQPFGNPVSGGLGGSGGTSGIGRFLGGAGTEGGGGGGGFGGGGSGADPTDPRIGGGGGGGGGASFVSASATAVTKALATTGAPASISLTYTPAGTPIPAPSLTPSAVAPASQLPTSLPRPRPLVDLAMFATSPTTVAVSTRGAFRYEFTAFASGSALFETVKRVTTPDASRKRLVLSHTAFTPSRSGAVGITVRLSKTSLRALNALRRVRVKLTVLIGARTFEHRFTLTTAKRR